MPKSVKFALIFILVGILLPASGWPAELEEKPALTLEEAVALALERNQQVLIARTQSDVLRGRYREVRAQALPSLTFNSSALRWRDPSFLNSSSFDKIPADFRNALQVTPANLLDYNVSVSQPLYTSGKVGTALKLASLESEGAGVDRGSIFVELDPMEERKLSEQDLMDLARRRLAKYRDLKVSVQPPAAMSVNEIPSNS
jgi:hypothetical protein